MRNVRWHVCIDIFLKEIGKTFSNTERPTTTDQNGCSNNRTIFIFSLYFTGYHRFVGFKYFVLIKMLYYELYAHTCVCVCVLLFIWCIDQFCSSVVRAFAHGAMGRRIDPPWGEPIELFLVPASAPRLV